MTTNYIQDSMVQPVINFSNNNTLIRKANTSKSISFTDTLAKVQSQGIKTHEEVNAAQGISAEDAKYLDAVSLLDGSEIYFPPDNAPIATKKAWIDSMKKMTNFQRAMTKAYMVFPRESCSPENSVNFINKMKENELNITSYQDIFKDYKQEMEKKLGNPSNSAEKNDCQQMIQGWNILINTFSSYNVK